MSSFMISDNYNLPGKIEAVKGMYPELRFLYRPALHEQRQQYLKAISLPHGGNNFEARTPTMASLVANHVKEWNVTDLNGSPAIISKENARLLHPSLLDALVDVILGYASSGNEEIDVKN